MALQTPVIVNTREAVVLNASNTFSLKLNQVHEGIDHVFYRLFSANTQKLLYTGYTGLSSSSITINTQEAATETLLQVEVLLASSINSQQSPSEASSLEKYILDLSPTVKSGWSNRVIRSILRKAPEVKVYLEGVQGSQTINSIQDSLPAGSAYHFQAFISDDDFDEYSIEINETANFSGEKEDQNISTKVLHQFPTLNSQIDYWFQNDFENSEEKPSNINYTINLKYVTKSGYIGSITKYWKVAYPIQSLDFISTVFAGPIPGRKYSRRDGDGNTYFYYSMATSKYQGYAFNSQTSAREFSNNTNIPMKLTFEFSPNAGNAYLIPFSKNLNNYSFKWNISSSPDTTVNDLDEEDYDGDGKKELFKDYKKNFIILPSKKSIKAQVSLNYTATDKETILSQLLTMFKQLDKGKTNGCSVTISRGGTGNPESINNFSVLQETDVVIAKSSSYDSNKSANNLVPGLSSTVSYSAYWSRDSESDYVSAISYSSALGTNLLRYQYIAPTSLRTGGDAVQKVNLALIRLEYTGEEGVYINRTKIAELSFVGSEIKNQVLYFEDKTVLQGHQYLYIVTESWFNRENSSQGSIDFTYPVTPCTVPDDDGLYIVGQRQTLRVLYDVNISSVKRNIQDTFTQTLGGKYPYVRRNGSMNYNTFSIEGIITYNTEILELPPFSEESSTAASIKYTMPIPTLRYSSFISDYDINTIKDATDKARVEQEYRNRVFNFLTDGKEKLVKSLTEGAMIIRLSDVSISPKAELGRTVYTFSATATEIAEATYENCIKYGLDRNMVELERLSPMWEKEMV